MKKYRALIKIIAAVTALHLVFVIKDRAAYTDKSHLATFVSYTRRNRDNLMHISHIWSYTIQHILSTPLPHVRDFLQALTSRADTDRYIFLPMTDEGFCDMAINFYQSSLLAHRVDNFLFVGIGSKICEVLTNISIPCFYYANDPSASIATEFGQRAFNRKITIRTDMMMEALEANFTVILSDVDVAFLRNPLQQIKVNILVLLTYKWK